MSDPFGCINGLTLNSRKVDLYKGENSAKVKNFPKGDLT